MPRYIRTKKSARGYHFDGQSGMGSDLRSLRANRGNLIKKIADPADADDKKWAEEWLARIEAEIAKKERTKSQKSRERKPSSRRPKNPPKS